MAAAQGNDTINLSGVNDFTVADFAAGDVIDLGTTASAPVIISGGIRTGNVTVRGVEKVYTEQKDWAYFVYQEQTLPGAKSDGLTRPPKQSRSRRRMSARKIFLSTAITKLFLTAASRRTSLPTQNGLSVAAILFTRPTANKTAETFAGYRLANNQISYVEASGGETLLKILNAQSLDGISLNNKTVTIGAQSFTFTADADENILTFTLDDSGTVIAINGLDYNQQLIATPHTQ